MPKRIAPSAVKAQERAALLQGPTEVESGEEWLSTLGQLATERVLQDALEREQTELLGRNRYERCGTSAGYRNGYEDGTLKTAEGVLRVKGPQSRGLEEPPRSQVGAKLAKTSDRLKTLIVEMFVGGMAQRDIEAALEKSLGQFVLSKSSISTMTDTLSQEYEAFRTRALSGYDVAYLFIDTVYEPLRRWGSKTGILCVWGIGVDGRKVLLSLSPTNSESYESCLEV
jgi:transposase-like protein